MSGVQWSVLENNDLVGCSFVGAVFKEEGVFKGNMELLVAFLVSYPRFFMRCRNCNL